MQRELIVASLIGALGAVCLAAGIMGLTGTGQTFHPALNDVEVATTAVVAGIVLMVWELRLILPVLKAKVEEQKRS